jgi:NhaP-type Na+/H+ or K+/H+ antiporter
MSRNPVRVATSNLKVWSQVATLRGHMFGLAIVAAIFIAYMLMEHRLESKVSGPMIFMTLGLLISPEVFNVLKLDLNGLTVQIVLKGALALVLFTEASTLRTRRLATGLALPTKLLTIAMPLIMILGLVVAAVLFDVLSFWEAAVVGVLLAPTDAALVLPIVDNERVPQRIRDALVVEGGLNDGLAVPFVLFAAGLADVVAGGRSSPGLVELLVSQIGLAILVGVGAGWLGSKVANAARRTGWTSETGVQLGLLGLAVVTFAAAEAIHGNGFIAVWLAGLLLGRFATEDVLEGRTFSVRLSHLLVLMSFMIFGALGLAPFVTSISWQIAVYAILSLAILRPLAVGLSLIGSGQDIRTAGFIGWFGPRGLPSMVLALIVMKKDFALPNGDLILGVMAATVALSVYAHGITAGPLGNRYADWCERFSPDHDRASPRQASPPE